MMEPPAAAEMAVLEKFCAPQVVVSPHPEALVPRVLPQSLTTTPYQVNPWYYQYPGSYGSSGCSGGRCGR